MTLANAFIKSHLNYCKFYQGLPRYSIHRLQKKNKNSVAHIVTSYSHFSHITPILKSLHWLPVKYHVTFKLS